MKLAQAQTGSRNNEALFWQWVGVLVVAIETVNGECDDVANLQEGSQDSKVDNAEGRQRMRRVDGWRLDAGC